MMTTPSDATSLEKLREYERLGRIGDEGFILDQHPQVDTSVESHGRGPPIVVFPWNMETSKIRRILRNKGVKQGKFWRSPSAFKGIYHQPEFIEEDGRDIVREKVSTCVRVVEHLR